MASRENAADLTLCNFRKVVKYFTCASCHFHQLSLFQFPTRNFYYFRCEIAWYYLKRKRKWRHDNQQNDCVQKLIKTSKVHSDLIAKWCTCYKLILVNSMIQKRGKWDFSVNLVNDGFLVWTTRISIWTKRLCCTLDCFWLSIRSKQWIA